MGQGTTDYFGVVPHSRETYTLDLQRSKGQGVLIIKQPTLLQSYLVLHFYCLLCMYVLYYIILYY